MTPVLLGEVKAAAKAATSLGYTDDAEILRYINRAIKVLAFKANWDLTQGTIDVCVGCDGCVTLPSDVGIPLAVNVGGFPTVFRNSWYQFHINGLGSVGPGCSFNTYSITDDRGWSPVFQQLKDYSYLSAIVENAEDGPADNSKFLTVFGITMDANFNEKEVSFQVPMVYGQPYPNTTYQLKRVTRVIKPVTKGYVKLIGYTGVEGGEAVTVGYYSPSETQPRYRKIQVNQSCTWVRVRYQKTSTDLVNDYDIVPVPHMECILAMLKSINFSENDDIVNADIYELRAVKQMTEYESAVNPQTFSIQFDPNGGWPGTIDCR